MNELVQFDKNFNFRIRRDHGKISYERHVYESVDDKSQSSAISRKLVENIIQVIEGERILIYIYSSYKTCSNSYFTNVCYENIILEMRTFYGI